MKGIDFASKINHPRSRQSRLTRFQSCGRLNLSDPIIFFDDLKRLADASRFFAANNYFSLGLGSWPTHQPRSLFTVRSTASWLLCQGSSWKR